MLSLNTMSRSAAAQTFLALLLTGMGYAAESPELPLEMQIRPSFFARTVPHFRSDPVRGPVLYTEFADLGGVIAFSGSEVFMNPIAEKLAAHADEPDVLSALLGIRLRFRPSIDDTEWKDVPICLSVQRSTPGDDYYWLFSIPTSDATIWKPGLYTLSAHVTYQAHGELRDVKVEPMPFEVRVFPLGTSEEVNLLTNIGLGLSQVRLRRFEAHWQGEALWSRVLKLYPYDACARNALANWAVQHSRPDQAVDHYKQMSEDFTKGRARRLESLLIPPPGVRRCSLALPPLSRQDYASLIQKKIDKAKVLAAEYRQVEADVNSALDEDPGHFEELVQSEKRWVALAAIRWAGERRARTARDQLLDRLEMAPSLYQVEITKSLAMIEGNDMIAREDMSPDDRRATIRFWIEQSAAGKQKSTRPALEMHEFEISPSSRPASQPSPGSDSGE